jgi:excisionase family DNA binding protein
MTSGNDGMSDRLLTVAEAAEVLRTSERFPRRLIAERCIGFIHVGRHVRIPESALREFIAAGRIPPITTKRKRDAALWRNDDSAGSVSFHQAATRRVIRVGWH